jgi:hypothetical protein
MDPVDGNSTRPRGRWQTLAMAACAVAFALPAPTASADPVPPPPPAPAPAPAPPAPNAPPAPPPPADPVGAPPGPAPNAPPPPPPAADPNAPQPARIDNPVGGFSYVLPGGWVESDATHLDYGSALLSKQTGPPAGGQPPPVANDTRIVLGKLDQKLYASAEADNTKAATRLASDMGEFYMPYPGTRINQANATLGGPGSGVTGGASYYEVKFSDASKPNGQIWAGVVAPTGPNLPPGAANSRWFIVWLGTSNDPVDVNGAKALAESVRPLGAPPAAPAPAPGAPPPPAPGAPPPAPAPGAPPPAPAPNAPAPAAPPPPPAPAPPPPGQPAGGNGPAPAPGAVST